MKKANGIITNAKGDTMFPVMRKGPAAMFSVSGTDIFFVGEIIKERMSLTRPVILLMNKKAGISITRQKQTNSLKSLALKKHRKRKNARKGMLSTQTWYKNKRGYTPKIKTGNPSLMFTQIFFVFENQYFNTITT